MLKYSNLKIKYLFNNSIKIYTAYKVNMSGKKHLEMSEFKKNEGCSNEDFQNFHQSLFTSVPIQSDFSSDDDETDQRNTYIEEQINSLKEYIDEVVDKRTTYLAAEVNKHSEKLTELERTIKSNCVKTKWAIGVMFAIVLLIVILQSVLKIF